MHAGSLGTRETPLLVNQSLKEHQRADALHVTDPLSSANLVRDTRRALSQGARTGRCVGAEALVAAGARGADGRGPAQPSTGRAPCRTGPALRPRGPPPEGRGSGA